MLFAAITWGTVHFLSTRYPPRLLKLYAAAGFGTLTYALAAVSYNDPLVASTGLGFLSNSQLPLLKRLLKAWFLTFPVIAVASAVPAALNPTTMVLAADAAMLFISYADQQGLLSKYV